MAFKLDIDTESIEQALMKQIAEDDALFGTEVSDPIIYLTLPET